MWHRGLHLKRHRTIPDRHMVGFIMATLSNQSFVVHTSFQQAPKYHGVRLDRMLNFKQHLEEVAGKVTSRVSLTRRLAGTTWGASAKTLRISTQAVVFPAAECCAPVWSRNPHVKKVDVAINSSLRTISGCLKPTPRFQLPVLEG